jgi:hypothetical protein
VQVRCTCDTGGPRAVRSPPASEEDTARAVPKAVTHREVRPRRELSIKPHDTPRAQVYSWSSASQMRLVVPPGLRFRLRAAPRRGAGAAGLRKAGEEAVEVEAAEVEVAGAAGLRTGTM